MSELRGQIPHALSAATKAVKRLMIIRYGAAECEETDVQAGALASVALRAAASAGSQEPAPADAEPNVYLCDSCNVEQGGGVADKGDTACSSCGRHDAPHVYAPARKFGSVDGASPVRDDRTWTIKRQGYSSLETALRKEGAVQTISGPDTDFVEVVPRSEMARVQERYQQMCSKEMSAWQKVEVLSEHLDQAREALKEIVAALDALSPGAHSSEEWEAATRRVDVARDRAAASGVTEKGDRTDG